MGLCQFFNWLEITKVNGEVWKNWRSFHSNLACSHKYPLSLTKREVGLGQRECLVVGGGDGGQIQYPGLCSSSSSLSSSSFSSHLPYSLFLDLERERCIPSTHNQQRKKSTFDWRGVPRGLYEDVEDFVEEGELRDICCHSISSSTPRSKFT